MLPNPDILNDYPHGKFVLSNLAAKRAKQLREGAPPLVQTDSTHPLTIALAEIAAGKIKPSMPKITSVIEPSEEPLVVIDESMPAELGILLPALDDAEAAHLSIIEEEHEAELAAEDSLSISDLVGEEEDEVAVVAEDEPLSLGDLAEQENAEAEEVEDEN
jgi:DNA-directed RNA polymerase subunit omega